MVSEMFHPSSSDDLSVKGEMNIENRSLNGFVRDTDNLLLGLDMYISMESNRLALLDIHINTTCYYNFAP